MIDLLEAYQPGSNPGRPPRVPLPARAKKAGRQKLTRGRGRGFPYPRGQRRLDGRSSVWVDQRGLDDPCGRPRTTQRR
ncbi:hypothetical protein DY000_02006217 [Brassica cretica]|uniref:AP2/ERF domain-containing protein n=1 Tax=Brassica cretica TaxID=69181 RepID=A0ABQ7CI11_BRACR|nr:hypothetical protein DY000_02006217 [Brassica cretica]